MSCCKIMCLPYTVNGHFCFSWSINKSHYIDSKIFLQCKFDFVTEVDGSLGSIYDFHCLRLYNIIWNHIRSIFLLTSSITILCRNFPFMPWKQDSKNLESSVFLIHFIFLFIWIHHPFYLTNYFSRMDTACLVTPNLFANSFCVYRIFVKQFF